MGLTARQFVDSLSSHGILSTAQLSAVGERLSGDAGEVDAESVARELVEQRKLTKFQAQNVYQGRGKGLVYGEYVVLDKLGEGGMGQVYKAQHRRMKRIAALKVLPPSAVDSPRAAQRFHQEVEVAAQLQHPNIVIAYDAGEAHGRHFLVMEYVDGIDLSAYVTKFGPLGVEQAANVVLQAARGLAYAHSLGIIHRDIKPSNLLLTRQGQVKILDMGLARFDNPLADASVPVNELTASGEVMGTVDYMSPEQASDTRTADHRADIYALGCTLYRILIGKPPYTGETMIQKILAHREQPIPSLRAARNGVPDVLDRMFQKMLAKDVAERTPAMSQVVAGLEKLLGGVSEERSSVVLGEEGRQADSFDFSLLPSPAGPSGVLAAASNIGGSSVGGLKPGSASSGPMMGAPTMAAAARTVPTAARVVTARRVETATAGPSNGSAKSRSLPMTWTVGGAVLGAILAVALYLVVQPLLRNNKSSDDVAGVVPVAESAPTPEQPVSAESTATPVPAPSALAAPTAVSFFAPATVDVPAVVKAEPQPAPTTSPPSPPVDVGTTPMAVSTATAAAAPGPKIEPTIVATVDLNPAKPGTSRDLLRLIDVNRAVVGNWEFNEGVLASPSGGPVYPRIQIPFTLPEEYELRVTAVPRDSGAGVRLGFVVGPSYAVFAVDGGKRCGLEYVDNQSFDENPTSIQNLTGLGGGRPIEFLVRVRPNNVVVVLNGQPVVDWQGDPRMLSLIGPFAAGIDRTKPFIGTANTAPYRITKFEAWLYAKRPVPPTDSIAVAQIKVRELVGELPAGADATQKSVRAVALRERATMTDDDALRYALLTEAVRGAAAADDLKLLFSALEGLTRNFDVDVASTLNEALSEVVSRTRPIKERTEAAFMLMNSAQEQMKEERYEFGVAVVKAASSLASKTTDNDLKREVRYLEQEAEEYRRLFTAAEPALRTLAEKPDDAAANLAVGTYLIAAQGDWKAGLPHLAKGGELAVQTAALLEVQAGSDMSRAADVGAAWIEAADKSPLAAKAVFFEYARQYFADGAASTKSVATSKMLTRFKKVEGDVLRTAGSAFVKRHPPGATAFGGHWYQFIPEMLSWPQARDHCRKLGGHLVCIETAAENQWIYQFAAAQFGKPDPLQFLIGATEYGHDRVFTWVNGSPFQFSDWGNSYPDPTQVWQGCCVNRGSTNQYWIDTAKGGLPFICEWDR